MLWFLAPMYKIRSHIKKPKQFPEHSHVRKKKIEKREEKQNLGGGVFIEWCERVCNDRRLIKWSFGF